MTRMVTFTKGTLRIQKFYIDNRLARVVATGYLNQKKNSKKARFGHKNNECITNA